MLRPILAFAALGFVGLLSWKVLFFPLLAGVFGFLVKIALIAGIAFLLLWFFKKKSGDATPEQP